MDSEINYEVVLPIAITAAAFVVVSSYFLNRYLWGPAKGSPEAEAWKSAKRELSFRQRSAVRRALLKGQLIEPELRPHVLVYGAYVLEGVDPNRGQPSKWTWFFIGSLVVIGVTHVADGNRFRSAFYFFAAATYAYSAVAYNDNRLLPKIEKSMELNRQSSDRTN